MSCSDLTDKIIFPLFKVICKINKKLQEVICKIKKMTNSNVLLTWPMAPCEKATITDQKDTFH